MTPDSLYAGIDEPNADIDLILGQLADWYADHCDERREAACRWMVAHGKRPHPVNGWLMATNWWPELRLPLVHADYDGLEWTIKQWYESNQPIPDYYRHAIDALADQWPAEVADWWHALRERGEEPVAGVGD